MEEIRLMSEKVTVMKDHLRPAIAVRRNINGNINLLAAEMIVIEWKDHVLGRLSKGSGAIG